jgi:hypothetical protein
MLFMKKILFTLFLFSGYLCHSQDIILKTDKSELKAKVVEINDAEVKYKKWDNLEGPVYSMGKTNIFMIIYANGQREIFRQANTSPVTSNAGPEKSSQSNQVSSLEQSLASSLDVDTLIDYRNIKIKYKPSRFIYWFQETATLGLQQEFRLVKNVLNMGTSTDFFFVTGYSQTLYSVYLVPYLPLNRMMGNYENQDKGLFINAKLGYSSLSVSWDGNTEYAGGLMLGAGADYFISKGFGLSVSAFKFKDSQVKLQAGICVNIL